MIESYFSSKNRSLFVLSHVQVSATPWTVAQQVPFSRDFPGKNTGVDSHFLLQGIFPTHRLNPCLLSLLHWPMDSLPTESHGKLHLVVKLNKSKYVCIYIYIIKEL